MSRMNPSRTFILLLPPAVLVFSLFFVISLSSYMHRCTNLRGLHLGTVWEIVRSSQTESINRAVQNVQQGGDMFEDIRQLKIRFQVDEDRGGLVIYGQHPPTPPLNAALGTLDLEDKAGVHVSEDEVTPL